MRALLCVVVVAGCKDAAPAAHDAAVTVTTSSIATTAAPIATTLAPKQVTVPPAPVDAGLTGCAMLVAASRLAVPGPYAVVVRAPGRAAVYAQTDGAPVLAGTVDASSASAAAPDPSARAHLPPCASAGTFLFCASPSGEVRRYKAATDSAQRDALLLHARGGTPLAAALVGGRPVVAYVRDQTSADGTMLGAYIAGEDGSELRLSEDGAGATTVALTARTDGAVAAYVDAKRGMSPVHARLVAATPKITLGPDVVTFIAGTAEAYTRVALGSTGAAAFELLPIAHDMSFGLGVVKIDTEPQMDATLAWSDYPNGLDPAPVAATSGAEAVFVARVRPSAPQFGSPRVLELGRLDGAGTFTSFGLVPSRGTTLDVALASDGQDLVLAYTDGAGGWATRLRCGAR